MVYVHPDNVSFSWRSKSCLVFYRLLSVVQSFIYGIIFPFLIPVGIWPFVLMSLAVIFCASPMYGRYGLCVWNQKSAFIRCIMCCAYVVSPWIEKSHWCCICPGCLYESVKLKVLILLVLIIIQWSLLI